MTSVENFQFPKCWSDDVRMTAMFAPFRSKSVNPTLWNSKMKFWSDLIESYCKFCKSPVVEISNLSNGFSRKGSGPACLDEVIQHLRSTGILIEKNQFMTLDETWKGWAFRVLVTNPLKWTYNSVKSTIVKTNNEQVPYIHLPVVKYLGEELLKRIPSSERGKAITMEDLTKRGIDNPENLSLILHWLQKQGTVAVRPVKEEVLVKFPKSGTQTAKITETDIAVNSLERQEKVLEENIKKLESEMKAALEETKRHLRDKTKNLAKISLMRKQKLEKTIEKRIQTLENIQAILLEIDQTKLDADVVECYQKGIATLKRIFRETGLNEDVVAGTIDELREVLDNRATIDEELSRPIDPSLEEGLEDELNKLLLEDAPEVPTESLPVTPEELPVAERKSKDADNLERRMEALSF